MEKLDNFRDRSPLYETMLQWRSAVGLLLSEGKRPNEADGVGTAFLVKYEGFTFLVTALHNLSYLESREFCGIRFGDEVFPLAGQGFLPSVGDDLAVGWIDWEEAARRKADLSNETISSAALRDRVNSLIANAIEIETSVSGRATDFGLLGYPESRNRLQSHEGSSPSGPNAFAITFDLEGIVRSPDGDFERLLFSYDQKAKGVPRPNGLSGSPIIGLALCPISNAYRATLWGVAVEQRKAEKILIAMYVGKLILLLDKLVDKMRNALQGGLT